MSERAIQNDIRAAINRTGRARLVRNNVGVDVQRGVRYGLNVGSPDLVGVLRSGRAFCIEVKAKDGRLRREQICWWRAAQSFGITGGVARSVPEAMDLLEAAERGEAPKL